MTRTMLRERVHGHHARVTNLELFFDLVFVFAITQLSHSLLAHLNLEGAIHAGFLMMAVWWVWVFTAWITNWLDPDHRNVRVMLFVLMAVGLVMSTSVPEAFEARAVPFALAYAGMQVGRSLFMRWAARADPLIRLNFTRISAWMIVAAAFWIAGAFQPELRLALWVVALAIEYVGPAAGFWTPGLKGSATSGWTVEGAHLAERCGLFIIICLGESVLVTGATFAQHAWEPPLIGAALAALAAAIAMWWIYFNAHAEAAAAAIAHSDDPGRIARIAYTYAHIPIVAGIIVTAAGDELALAHPLGHIEPATMWLILGGPALFLAGGVWFKHAVFRVISAPRASGLALLGLVALAAPHLTPLMLSAAATAVLIVVATWETLTLPAPHANAHG
ncbi:MAG: low temperature requirement protein A [Alphaproteobacteria bacterium]|nr:low temperature requirement protein A [Alphaproteobacteria bacterium]MBU1514000.1 low temperature requirement protein A [Alphaproteobacteria bacterium]MBU2093060.1 low temperature requirement protein A [Alphaproteobacteria bacterium]MBU2151737.1 low temperature requirement protein A [Alphaproteobacteria bacterium]MBU2309443.1 low temperature requirement protein A [Alphaproteobacteria bacterium]